jgi:hypothetical protein
VDVQNLGQLAASAHVEMTLITKPSTSKKITLLAVKVRWGTWQPRQENEAMYETR